MKHFLPLLALVFFVGCRDSDAPAHSETVAVSTESPSSQADSGELTGTWELVEQRGYGLDHPDDVEQILTLDDNGRMSNVQSAGGQSTKMILTYRVEGDQIKASVESVEMNGTPLEIAEVMPEQTFRWQFESGRLILEGAQPGTQDVYRRAD